MSGALFFYFWSWDGAPAPPPPPPAPAPGEPGSGGGKSRGKGKGRPDYVQLSQEHWDERERYLRTIYPEEIEPAPPPDDSVAQYKAEMNRQYEARQQQLTQLTSERAAAIAALRSSPDLQSMQRQGSHITELNAKIAELTGKQAFTRFIQ